MNSNFCGNSDITKIFIVEPSGGGFTGNTVNGNLYVTGDLYNCGTGTTFVQTISACTNDIINVGSNLYPTTDNTWNIGTPFRRFRDVNTISGTSTVWVSTTSITTPLLDLGIDSSGNTRQITADNSIIQDDCLLGGIY